MPGRLPQRHPPYRCRPLEHLLPERPLPERLPQARLLPVHHPPERPLPLEHRLPVHHPPGWTEQPRRYRKLESKRSRRVPPNQ